MPFNLIPINNGAEVSAANLWHNLLQLVRASGLTANNTDTVDYYHVNVTNTGTSLVAPSSIVITDSTGYIPSGLIPPSIISGLQNSYFIRTAPASAQTSVTASIQNNSATSAFVAVNLNAGGHAMEVENTSAALNTDAFRSSISGLSGIALLAQYNGAAGTNANPLAKLVFANELTNKPFIEMYQGATKVAGISGSGHFTTNGNISLAGTLTSTLAYPSSPLAITSSGLVSNLNVDQLDGHHWSDLVAFVSSATGYLPITGGTETGPVIFDSTINVNNALTTSPTAAVTGSSVTSAYSVFQIQALGSQNLFTALNNASGVVSTLDLNGNLTISGAISGTQGKFNPALGLPPLAVSSSGWVANLNADYLDNRHGSDYALTTEAVLTRPDLVFGSTQSGVRADITSNWNDQAAIKATNVSGGFAGYFVTPYISGASTYTPAAYFANLNLSSDSSAIKLVTASNDVASGIPPIITASQARNINFNADLLDGFHAGDLIVSGYLLTSVNNEVINGVNGTVSGFTVAWPSGYIATSLNVYYNGLVNASGVDYLETSPISGLFTFYSAPTSGSLILVDYVKRT